MPPADQFGLKKKQAKLLPAALAHAFLTITQKMCSIINMKYKCAIQANITMANAAAVWIEPGQYNMMALPRSPGWGDEQLLEKFLADEHQLLGARRRGGSSVSVSFVVE